MRANRIGLDDAAVVDDRIHHLASRGGSEFNPSAVGLEHTGIADERFQRLPGRDIDNAPRNRISNIQLDEPVSVEIERKSVG